MVKSIQHVHWPDAPDIWMPYAPAIVAKGGTTIYLAGVTAAPVYHHHPHRPEEFDTMPADMGGQARAALENLKKGASGRFAPIVSRTATMLARLMSARALGMTSRIGVSSGSSRS